MEYVFPSSYNEPLLRCCSPNKGSASTSKSLEEPPFHLHFPSPFLDDVSTTDHLIPQQNHINADQDCETNIFEYPNKGLNINTELYSSSGTATESTPEKEIKAKKVKRSSGKKDRHSKIHTAKGLRGRRMRLSIHIARKFFDLQDMLGFDKASKTLDWLFSKSKKAIKEVERTLPSEMGSNSQITSTGERGKSTLLECESGLENFTAIKTNARKGSTSQASNSTESLMGAERKPRKSRKSVLSPNDPVARESREKARARARERTMEKMMIKFKEVEMKKCEWLEANPNSTNLDKLGLGFPENPSTKTNMDSKSLGTFSSVFYSQKSSASAASGALLDSRTKSYIPENWDAANLRINPNANMDFRQLLKGKTLKRSDQFP